MTSNPFEGLEDQTPLGPLEALRGLLDSAKRGWVPIRNRFVQQPPGSATRSAVLAQFVTNRQERALDALLTLHALQPVLATGPLPLGAWANILSTRAPCSSPTASRTFRVLDDMGLLTRERAGHATTFTPLLEDGSREPWARPGSRHKPSDNYFILPHEFFTEGYIDRLRLPGKAMLLIMLKETQIDPLFSMAVDRAPSWYGISERTAERGYAELKEENLLDIHIQRMASPRLPSGVLRVVYHRALRGPFSTSRRAKLQRAASRAASRGLRTGASTEGGL